MSPKQLWLALRGQSGWLANLNRIAARLPELHDLMTDAAGEFHATASDSLPLQQNFKLTYSRGRE